MPTACSESISSSANDSNQSVLPPALVHYDRGVGRLLIIAGLMLVALGVLLVIGERLPVRFGRLPGDIVVRGKNGAFYFPIVTCLILSVLFSLVMWLFGRR
jgi:hypothetical protein